MNRAEQAEALHRAYDETVQIHTDVHSQALEDAESRYAHAVSSANLAYEQVLHGLVQELNRDLDDLEEGDVE